MTTYKKRVYRLLESENGVEDGIAEFMQALVDIEDELLELELEVSNQQIDQTGLIATRSMSELEAQHSQYLDELKQAHKAVATDHLNGLERNDGDDYSRQTQDQASDYRTHNRLMIERLEDISDRTGRRIDAKRNSANTRLIFTVSAIALGISIISLLTQVVFLRL